MLDNIAVIMLAVFFILTVFSAYLVYRSFTSAEIREQTRTRIQVILNERRQKILDESRKSKLEMMLQKAGNPLGLNAIRFRIIQNGFIGFLIIYYVIVPFIETGEFSMTAIAMTFLVYLLTSEHLRFSITSLLLSRIIKFRVANMNSELFMLYDMIQSELSNLNDHQEINTYSLLMDMQGYFNYIDRPLNKMLLKWKSGPSAAAEEFYTSLPTSEARALAEVLVKMDQTRCQDALHLIEGLAETFTEGYVENMKRKKEALDLILNIPVFGTQWLIFANLLIVMYLMISDLIDYANMPLGN